jgi:UDP-3-O-[3-hydroxymyristoyl] glucosamine N-acyltransferase
MADKRFFTVAGPFTLQELAGLTGAVLTDMAAASRSMRDVAPLDTADENTVSFLDNRKYAGLFKTTKAGACFVRPELAAGAPAGTACLTHKNPYKAYALAAQAFYPAETVREYRAPSAVIDPTAVLGRDCSVGPGVIIGRNVRVGNGCRIQAHAVIGDGVEMGDGCDIGPHTCLSHCILGNRIRLYPGVSVGRPGFGFAMDPAGFVSVPQLGRVLIGDDVEIGANTTIDRGAGPDTVIGEGTRIDNLVQIGHNVKIGRRCVIVAQTGVSGSTQFGDFVMAGGQSGFAGHLKIASGTRIAGQSGVMRNIDSSGEYMGCPAVPIRQFMRQMTLLSKMAGKKDA